jgi:hypothetical protein
MAEGGSTVPGGSGATVAGVQAFPGRGSQGEASFTVEPASKWSISPRQVRLVPTAPHTNRPAVKPKPVETPPPEKVAPPTVVVMAEGAVKPPAHWGGTWLWLILLLILWILFVQFARYRASRQNEPKKMD